MVHMSTFVESQHPRGQAKNAGQFREKENSAPSAALVFDHWEWEQILVGAGTLGARDALRGVEIAEDNEVGLAASFEMEVGRSAASEDEQSAWSAAYRTGWEVASKQDSNPDVDKLLSTYEDAKAEYIGATNNRRNAEDDYESYEDAMMGLVDDMASALRHHRAEGTTVSSVEPASVAEWQGLLADVNTMGGDEIRSLDDATLLRLDSYLLRAAARVQAATAERGLRHERTGRTTDVDKLELVDYRNVTEAQVASAWVAGVSQGIVGGVIRTKDDFYNHAMDELGEGDEELVARAWEKFHADNGLDAHNSDEHSWGRQEYLTWSSTIAESLNDARG